MNLDWLDNILRKYQAAIANVFLLHFNVTDLVDGIRPAEEFLLELPLFAERDIIIKYNRSAGIMFPRDAKAARYTDVPPEESEARSILGLDSDVPLPRDPDTALFLIEKLLRENKQTADGLKARVGVIIDYAETLVPNTDMSQMNIQDRTTLTTLLRWARDPELVQLGTPIILIAENLMDVHQSLRTPSSQIEPIQIPLPSYGARLTYVKQLAESDRFRDTVVLEVAPETIARLTAMLKLVHIEDMFLRAEDLCQPLNMDLVKERKREILAAEFEEVLESPDLDGYSLDMIGGMEHAIRFFQKNIIDPIRNNNLRRVPMGVLLCGPSGTGKTLLVRCVAKAAGLNNVDLNMAKIADKWVGSSERNLEKALTCIRALAPVIVTVDEIDQLGLSRESNDSTGVSNRIFRRLLEFMADPKLRGQIIFIGLTNRPDLMDPALKRPGRFDRKVPILVPNKKERNHIVSTLLRKYRLATNITGDQAKQIAENTDGYTGAELEALILKAADVAEDRINGDSELIIGWPDFEHALQAYRPTTQDIERMTQLALAECNDLDLLPPEWRQRLVEGSKPRKITYMPRTRR